MKLLTVFAGLLALFLLSGSAFSLACINISVGGAENIAMKTGVPNYISVRLYNSSATGGMCDAGTYSVKAELVVPSGDIDDFFDYSFSADRFLLADGENKRVLLSITPKVPEGKFNVLVTGTREAAATEGTKMVYTASAMVSMAVSDKGESTEVPFWVVRKDCPGGFVVKEGEECPAQPGTWQIAGLLNWLLFPAIAIAIIICALVLAIKKKEYIRGLIAGRRGGLG